MAISLLKSMFGLDHVSATGWKIFLQVHRGTALSDHDENLVAEFSLASVSKSEEAALVAAPPGSNTLSDLETPPMGRWRM